MYLYHALNVAQEHSEIDSYADLQSNMHTGHTYAAKTFSSLLVSLLRPTKTSRILSQTNLTFPKVRSLVH